MNICVVISRMDISPEGVLQGGHSNSVVRLLRGLGTRHEATLLTSLPEDQDACGLERLGLANVSVLPFTMKSPPASFPFAVEFLLKGAWSMLRSRTHSRFDLVHGHSGYAEYVLATLMIGAICKAPTVHTLYCPLGSKVESGKQAWAGALIAKRLLASLARIIAVSENVARSLLDAGIPREKIAIIPPPIDSASFNPGCTGQGVRRQIGGEGPIILSLAGLSTAKGQDILIQSMPMILRSFPGTKLVIILGEPLRFSHYVERRKQEILAKIDELGLREHVVTMAVIERMPELMAAADVVVAPFRSTSGVSDYPLTILEAMAVGKPVVATPVGGIPEIILDGKTGILVPPNDVHGLAGGIVDLLGNEEARAKIGENASRFVLGRFSIEKVSRQVERVYEEVKGSDGKKQRTGRVL